ncbi:MAG: 30S ribosome-binding factor RbfA [Gammaproteobacteria bacterium]|nr:30S ribosome-binding factor RbfA [Gammaproteobacteria bacterium]
MSNRRLRLGSLLQQELAKILQQYANDFAVNGVSITEVRPSPDLSYAKIYITVIESEKRQEYVNKLNELSPMLRHILAKNANLRKTPKLHFVYDESVIYGDKMSKLISGVE